VGRPACAGACRSLQAIQAGRQRCFRGALMPSLALGVVLNGSALPGFAPGALARRLGLTTTSSVLHDPTLSLGYPPAIGTIGICGCFSWDARALVDGVCVPWLLSVAMAAPCEPRRQQPGWPGSSAAASDSGRSLPDVPAGSKRRCCRPSLAAKGWSNTGR